MHREALRTGGKRAEIDTGERSGTTSEDAASIAEVEAHYWATGHDQPRTARQAAGTR